MELLWKVITLYKPRMPSVLYIFTRASNIPLYCRLDGSTPALYCSTSRVLVTHIGFVMHRVMAPENTQKLLSLLCQLHRLSQSVQSNITQASTMTKLLLLPEHSYCSKQVKFMPSVVPSLSLQSSQWSPIHSCCGTFAGHKYFCIFLVQSLFCFTFPQLVV